MFLAKFYSAETGWLAFNWAESRFAQDEHDAGIPDANAPSVALIAGDSMDTGAEFLLVKTPYTRTLRGRLIHDSAAGLQAGMDALHAAYGVKGSLWKHRLTHGYRWLPARIISLPQQVDHSTLYRYGRPYLTADVEIQFQIYQGLWNGLYHGDDLVLPSGMPLEVLGSDRVLGYDPASDVLALGTTGTITNAGDRPQHRVVMTVTATSIGGISSNLTVTNTTTGTAWTYSGGLANGDVLVVDTADWSVRKNGVAAFFDSSFQQKFSWTKERWFVLRHGANQITTDAGGGTGTIAFAFSDAHTS